MSGEEIDYSPRSSRDDKRKARRERARDEYTPRPSRRSKSSRHSRQRTSRSGGKRGRLLDRKNLGRLAAVAALLVLVVPLVLVAVIRDQPAQDPELTALLARLQENPDDYDALVSLGNYYLFQGEDWLSNGDPGQAVAAFGEAARYYEPALILDPANNDLRIALGAAVYFQGIAYEQLGQADQAVAAWQWVIELLPGTDYAQDAQQQIDAVRTIGP